jgi:hypothetical protein
MATGCFLCLSPVMRELPYLQRPQSAAPPPPPGLSQAQIPIKWDKIAVKTIKIRQRPVEIPTQARSIYLQSTFLQRRVAQRELESPGRRVFASRPGRRET